MAMNNMGAGFILTGRDNASPVLGKFRANLGVLRSALGNIGIAMGAIGAASFRMGAGIAAAYGQALEANRRFGKSVAEVSTITDMSTMQIRDTALEMSVAFGTTAEEQAAALYQTISAGVTDAADATKLLATANKLAVGGVTDTKTAVDGLTTVVNAYEASQLDATDVADAFFVAIREGKTTAAELSNSIGRVAPVAQDAGIAFDELLGSIAAVTTKGIDTAQTTSGLAAALGNIAKPTADARKEAQRLGIEFSKNAIRTKGWKGFLDSITQSAGFNKDSMDMLFGSIEGVKVMTALASNDSSKLNDVLGKMETRVGATDAAFREVEATYDHQIKKLNALREAIQKTFGKSIERLAAPLVRVFNGIAGAFQGLLKNLPPQVVDGLTSLFGALAGIASVVGGLIGVIALLNIFGVTLTGVVSSLVAFAGLMLPLTLLVAGLGVGFVAASKAMQTESGKNESAWQSMSRTIKSAYQGIIQIISKGELSEEFKKQLEDMNQTGVLKFLKGFQNFVEKAKHFWDGLVIGFEMGVLRLGPHIQRLKNEFSGIFDLFSDDKPGETMEKWVDSGISAGETLASLGGEVIDMFTGIVKIGKDVAKSLKGITAQDISNGITSLVNGFRSLWSFLGKTWEVLKGIGRAFSTIWNVIQLLVMSIKDLIALNLGNIADAFKVYTFQMSSEEAKKSHETRAKTAFADTGIQWGDLKNVLGETAKAYMKYGVEEARNRAIQDFVKSEQGQKIVQQMREQRRPKSPGPEPLSQKVQNQLLQLAAQLKQEQTALTVEKGQAETKKRKEQIDEDLARTMAKLNTVLDRLEKGGVKAQVSYEAVADAANQHAENDAGRNLSPGADMALGF